LYHTTLYYQMSSSTLPLQKHIQHLIQKNSNDNIIIESIFHYVFQKKLKYKLTKTGLKLPLHKYSHHALLEIVNILHTKNINFEIDLND